MRTQEHPKRYRREPTKDETAPVVEWDEFPHTHAVRCWLVSNTLAMLTAPLPAGTTEALQARIGEVDPEWMAQALKVMRSEV